ncbi:hypothetical protein CH63R_11480 [Colletotrichum higginsianum IMI 349063]|uniref:Uncharacterized protein n=1 Tax=Colletotrichum higginsianum (strain IMI 349063) TaxID=759273 RepID=A0A1B7XYC7_COLHI|nr:hypothetical protein CH63R_11480 [Colletotrichum higginsianum IMI 349063]OBR04777.1 hypothetical protein CH63R_11480 [Colletotrichum higginsianum IMI 349063]
MLTHSRHSFTQHLSQSRAPVVRPPNPVLDLDFDLDLDLDLDLDFDLDLASLCSSSSLTLPLPLSLSNRHPSQTRPDHFTPSSPTAPSLSMTSTFVSW